MVSEGELGGRTLWFGRAGAPPKGKEEETRSSGMPRSLSEEATSETQAGENLSVFSLVLNHKNVQICRGML